MACATGFLFTRIWWVVLCRLLGTFGTVVNGEGDGVGAVPGIGMARDGPGGGVAVAKVPLVGFNLLIGIGAAACVKGDDGIVGEIGGRYAGLRSGVSQSLHARAFERSCQPAHRR